MRKTMPNSQSVSDIAVDIARHLGYGEAIRRRFLEISVYERADTLQECLQCDLIIPHRERMRMTHVLGDTRHQGTVFELGALIEEIFTRMEEYLSVSLEAVDFQNDVIANRRKKFFSQSIPRSSKDFSPLNINTISFDMNEKDWRAFDSTKVKRLERDIEQGRLEEEQERIAADIRRKKERERIRLQIEKREAAKRKRIETYQSDPLSGMF